MPKTKSTAAPHSAEVVSDPVTRVREHADALYRSAAECCRQHERLSHITEKSEDESEVRLAEEVAALCDAALATMVEGYEQCAASVHPDNGDDAWWHRANSLWHASREFARRHSACDHAARQRGHSAEQLGELAMDYELEASSLFALQQATTAYRKERPEA